MKLWKSKIEWNRPLAAHKMYEYMNQPHLNINQASKSDTTNSAVSSELRWTASGYEQKMTISVLYLVIMFHDQSRNVDDDK